jgi:hypothetical protein
MAVGAFCEIDAMIVVEVPAAWGLLYMQSSRRAASRAA